ncbi:hypothetical protein [Brevibacillus parabrevis]|uniref:hypothetical protein n=1 Tax=Brevibacillus parabrevis TaxID=54914 RepID=UPI0028D0D408|nr:hypothetical protein [Brevibacillus parabrevis]
MKAGLGFALSIALSGLQVGREKLEEQSLLGWRFADRVIGTSGVARKETNRCSFLGYPLWAWAWTCTAPGKKRNRVKSSSLTDADSR